MGIQSKDRRDYYYYKAKAMGYRARSAFKLLDINTHCNIFENIKRVVDLCAAPGSWSQVLAKNTTAKIIAVDIQDMSSIEGVTILKGDITSEECMKEIINIFEGEDTDLIVCDGAPDVTGFHDLDEFLQLDLLKSSLYICNRLLKENGVFVGKCFRGGYSGFIVNHFMKFFNKVELLKPKASRNVSVECFLVCSGFKKCDIDPFNINIDIKYSPVPAISCGDGPDPDFTNESDIEIIQPLSKPINPPYEESINIRQQKYN